MYLVEIILQININHFKNHFHLNYSTQNVSFYLAENTVCLHYTDQSIKYQKKKKTGNVTVRRIFVTIVAVEGQSILHILSAFL